MSFRPEGRISFGEKLRSNHLTGRRPGAEKLRHNHVWTRHSALISTSELLYERLAEAIQESTASTKVFVANLDEDQDIQGLTVSDLIDKALELMGDPEGTKGLINYVLCDSAGASRKAGILPGKATGETYKGAQIINGTF